MNGKTVNWMQIPILAGLAGLAATATAGNGADRSWQGGAEADLWSAAANWREAAPPDPQASAALSFPAAGTSRMDRAYSVGALTFSTAAHTIALAGHALTTGTVTAGSPGGTIAGPGVLRIGTPENPGDILIDRSASLVIAPGATLGGTIGAISGDWYLQDSWLDLRGVRMEHGVLDVGRILMGERRSIYLDATTTIHTLRIREALRIFGRRGRWIGDPADTEYHRLPANLTVVIGSDDAPAVVDLGHRTTGSYFDMGPVHFNASTGGSFTGRLSRLRVAHSGHGGTGPTDVSMDLAGMTACDIVTETFSVGTSDFDYRSNPREAGPVRAMVSLPPGQVRTGTLTIGREAPRDAANRADLLLKGTRLTVRDAVTVLPSGRLDIAIGETAGGLQLAETATLAIDGALRITFSEEPANPYQPHYGLRWTGDHVDTLNALIPDAITIDAQALSKPVTVYAYRGITYLGLLPIPTGCLLLLL